MDLSYSHEDEEFRARVRRWLRLHLAEAAKAPREPSAAIEHAKAWQRRMYEAGFVGIAWPEAYGGQAASLTQQVVLNEELARSGAPPLINTIGLNILGPALILHGSEEQKRRFLPRILAAEDIWCQGFSEPDAGSDLAALRTRAVVDGDVFIVNGQKLWTSLGPIADWCFLLVRTDTAVPKQEGISYLLMDMKSPGVRTAPIRQITGKRHFSELFLDDVRVPRANLVGELNRGWLIAKATLSFERSGLAGVVELEHHLEGVRRLAGALGRLQDPLIRQRLVQLLIEKETLKYTGYRALTQQLRGAAPGPESAVGKLASSELRARVMDLALEIEGAYAGIGRGNARALDRGRWQGLYLDARAYTIGGGTSEVMRNIIAERALGLPKSTAG
ncbi:MAG: acyl-CoA dehydrogenase family protein [Deltaproteobacteria bacterium]|nr:acyl-CoA dehydrogenase family protein [Deltaproteobacteria bacterium]